MTHNVYLLDSGARSFVMFNERELSSEPVTDSDLVQVTRSLGDPCASLTWSCGLQWYFVVWPDGISLFNVYETDGYHCKKLSMRFIEMFIGTPYKKIRKQQ